MYVCCYVWFTYAREVCIHCISIYGEAYARAFGSCVYGVVIGRATFLFVVIGRATIFLLRSIRGVRDGLRGVIDRDWVHSNLRSDRDGLRDFIDVSRCLCGL